MKKFFLLIILAALTISVRAKSMKFVYIGHDVNSPVERLVEKIEGYMEVVEDSDSDDEEATQVILYLSSGSNPLVANMRPGKNDKENFDKIVSELYERNYHEVDVETDIYEILDLFSKNDFLDASGSLKVSALDFEFYVTPAFWSLEQNESLIATLFHTLSINKFYDPTSPLYDPMVSFKIFLPSVDELRQCIGTEESPKLRFGIKNLSQINTLLKTSDLIGKY